MPFLGRKGNGKKVRRPRGDRGKEHHLKELDKTERVFFEMGGEKKGGGGTCVRRQDEKKKKKEVG